MSCKKTEMDESDSSEETTSHESSSEIHEVNKVELSTDKLENTQGATKDFKLSCLHNLDEQTLSSVLTEYFQMSRQFHSDTMPRIGKTQKLTSDFTTWWEEFTKPNRNRDIVTSSAKQHKDGDTYDSWFCKSVTGDTSWLCGAGTSASPLLKKTQAVEDINVPSIYDNKPALKGRRALKRERKAEREKTLGKKWFGMKAPDVDDKLKNDMELIRMRSVLDPKRFYKHQDRKALPKYFQMGTVVDEGTDFFSSRLTKKQRKQTLVEELMADVSVRQYNKKKYAELQQKMRKKKKFKKTAVK